MAKNLKLNVKNTQLAEALKLSRPKKPRTPKEEKPVEAPPAKEEIQKAEPKKAEPKKAAAPAPAPKKEEKAPAPKAEEKAAAAPAPASPPASAPTSAAKPLGERKTVRNKLEPRPKRMLEGFVKPAAFRPGYRRGGPPPSSDPAKKREANTEGRPQRGPQQRRDNSSGGDFRSSIRRTPAPAPTPAPKENSSRPAPAHKKHSSSFGNDRDARGQKKSLQNRSFDARDRQGLRDNSDERWRKRRTIKVKNKAPEEVIRPKELTIRFPISVKDLASEMKLKASQLISKLFMQGIVITLNDYLDDETTVQLLGHEFECEITIDTSEEERIRITDKTIKEEVLAEDASTLSSRPPVVAFMGHVDHGKTSLIDAIRKSNIAAGEAGAITQHIGAFRCHTATGDVTVLDTPGHEAFSSMRERGASVTDIVVLVVAGDDGIKAQTLEAIDQAKEAGVPMVIAINKCDKEDFDAEVVYRQLAERDLLPEAWGGSVITVNCSATTGEGVDTLLEMLGLQSEILELKASATMRARGSVIESEMHKGLGSVATILVQNGTLNLGDALVFDHLYAKVKTMHDEHGKEMTSAGPSCPVKITGLSGLPVAGSDFIAVKNEKEAKEIAGKRIEDHKTSMLQQSKKSSMEAFLQEKTDAPEKKVLNLILKADVQGSLEALKTSLRKLPSKKVELNFILESVGEISESDIQYAATSKATILGFHTCVESHAETLIKQTQTDIRLHDIIYHAVDDIRALMLSLLDKIPEEKELGAASVKTIFKSSLLGNIAGCQVTDGLIRRNSIAKVMRDGELIWKGPLSSLKRIKEDAKEVAKGLECGIVLQGFDALKEDDVIECFEVIYKQQELT